MSNPTLAQAQAALIAVQQANIYLAQMNNQLNQIQSQITSLSNYNPAADLAQATATQGGLTTLISYIQQGVVTEEAIISAYNAANPGAPIPTS